ncbi:MAG: hypothetical protein ABI794_17640 [Betaproteobacteria bacterium]
MFKKIRIAILALILVNVAVGTWLARARTTSWTHPLRVAVFPIVGDGSPTTASYVAALATATFDPVDEFFREEGRRYGLTVLRPVELRLAPRVDAMPPAPPYGQGALPVLLWSLHMRYWAWRHGGVAGPSPHVRLFVVYHDPKLSAFVPHSLGLQKGLIGVVHVFATDGQSAENKFVIAHELLHTVGATDKYDPATNLPIFPQGYGDPAQRPTYPQKYAEIMGGRIAVSTTEAVMPENLGEALVGAATAREIGWDRSGS